MKLFDAHCHLQDDALFPMVGRIVERAAEAGVARVAVCGTSSKDWKKVLQISEEFQQIIPMIGIHPWFVPMIGPEAKRERPRRDDVAATNQGAAIHPWFVEGRDGSPSCPDGAARPAVEPYLKKFQCLEKNMGAGSAWFQTMEEIIREFPMVGIGETGLDFQEKFTNRAEQADCFAAHLDLACELDRPVAVHCVQAWGRLIEILKEHPAPRVLLHAFGGSVELIPELTELNCWFSFCGNVTNPNAKRVRASAVAVPSDRLLIETDSPDFPPVGCSAPNEPANLIHVARAVAELRGFSVEVIANQTFTNSIVFFGVS